MKVVKLLLPRQPSNFALTEQEVNAYLKKHYLSNATFVATLADVDTWRTEPPYDREVINQSTEPHAFLVSSWDNLLSFMLLRELDDASELHTITASFQWLSRSIYTGLAIIAMLEEKIDQDVFLLRHKFRSATLVEQHPSYLQHRNKLAGFRYFNKWEDCGNDAENTLKIMMDITGLGDTSEAALAHYSELEQAYRTDNLLSIYDTLPAWLGGK